MTDKETLNMVYKVKVKCPTCPEVTEAYTEGLEEPNGVVLDIDAICDEMKMNGWAQIGKWWYCPRCRRGAEEKEREKQYAKEKGH
jgi:phage FluMu protein Com